MRLTKYFNNLFFHNIHLSSSIRYSDNKKWIIKGKTDRQRQRDRQTDRGKKKDAINKIFNNLFFHNIHLSPSIRYSDNKKWIIKDKTDRQRLRVCVCVCVCVCEKREREREREEREKEREREGCNWQKIYSSSIFNCPHRSDIRIIKIKR